MRHILSILLAITCLTVCPPVALRSAAADEPPRTPGPLPKCIDGWQIELVAAAPVINHPSVVCCAPDGRVFVAEDPMDIRTREASEPQGRIICLHPDGRHTVYAEGLFAVFGMQYLDGHLYVLHNPKFSRFRDQGDRGAERFDLIEQTNPNPWALNWNDHVPANFRLAPDGYFYVAVGDKGLYGAIGRDGSRVDLRGGGILRLRPDGTQLEVYSRGVRNILDVAIDPEGEIFTFDNTDEHVWMGRLTHMVDGGFYGYPHDFQPRQPYTLWMMADFGAGAATGTLCNNNDGLPAEYRGNLFLADFGKRQILRVELDRAGATFSVKRRTDLFVDPPGDFRPVGIAFDPAGASIYLCDWNHADTKEDVACGRLLRLRPTEIVPLAPKPAWYELAATGKQPAVSAEELIAQFEHPAEMVRMVAQRRLVERQTEAISPLKKLLRDPQASAQAKTHALWACDAIDGGKGAHVAILELARSGETPVKRQAIRQLGTRRTPGIRNDLINALHDAEASVRFQAATALGRIADPLSIEPLVAAAGEPDLFARYAVVEALRRIGQSDPRLWPMIAGRLAHKDPAIRQAIAFALRDQYQVEAVNALTQVLANRAGAAAGREAAARLLASLALRSREWQGEWWAYHPALAAPPAKSETWAGTLTVRGALKAALSDPDADVRLAASAGLRPLLDPVITDLLLDHFPREVDARVRGEMLRALGVRRHARTSELAGAVLQAATAETVLVEAAVDSLRQMGDDDARRELTRFVSQASAPAEALRSAISALGELKAAGAVEALGRLARRDDPAVRSAAVLALRDIGPDAATTILIGLAHDLPPGERGPVLLALGDSTASQAREILLEAWELPGTRDAACTALTVHPHPAALDAYLAGLADRDYLQRRQCADAIRAIRDEVRTEIEKKVTALPLPAVVRLQEMYRDDGAALQGPIFAIVVKPFDAAEYLESARTGIGDAARGRVLFEDARGMGCFKCHRVRGQGGEVGPDLTEIGDQFDRGQLAEHVLFPSKSIREGYQQVTVVLKSGKNQSGLVSSESTDSLVLRDADGKLHTLLKSQIEERQGSSVSLMPERLVEGISREDFNDLVTYLQSLRRRPMEGAKP